MKWFGEYWDAPVCDEGEQVETPIGHPCCTCMVPIASGDRGVMIAHYGLALQPVYEPWHLECLLSNIGVKDAPP